MIEYNEHCLSNWSIHLIADTRTIMIQMKVIILKVKLTMMIRKSLFILIEKYYNIKILHLILKYYTSQ